LEEKALEVNALLIIVAVIFLVGAVGGWKQGLIDGVIGLVSFILGLVVLGVTASAVGSYMQKSYIKVVVALVLLAVIGVINKVVRLVLDAFKLVRFIPIGKFADKVAGIVLGMAEALFIVWIAFFMFDNVTIMNLNVWVYTQISQSDLLTKLYNANIIDTLILNVTTNVNANLL
jgi:uncharacterized membrane protein required for colicin V production